MRKLYCFVFILSSLLSASIFAQPVGNTITMNGGSDHISVPDNPAWDLVGDFTLSVKVKFAVNKWHMLLTHHDGTVPQGFEFSYTGGNILLSPNGYQVCISQPWTAALNTWYTVSVSRQGNLFSAYVNGVLLGTNIFVGAIGTDDFPLMIGNYYYPSYNFYGEMDDVSIWNTAISTSQMQSVVAGTLTGSEPNLVAFYNMNRTGQGAGLIVNNLSSAGSVFNGVTVGSATTPYFNAAPTPAGALHFDGFNDGVVVNNTPSVQLNSGTAEAWIKTSNAGSSYRGIIVKQWAYSLFLYNNELICYDWSTGIIPTGIYLADNQWHHVAVSFANGVINGSKIYADGILVKTFTYHIVNQTIDLALGIGSNYSVQNFAGSIDEVRVWNRQLSLAEIQNNKNCEVPLPATGLVAYYKLNQGIENANNSGITTATDASGNGNNGSLINFGLTGSTSNWVAGNINGICAVFSSAYNIISSSGANGIISPSGTTSVASGGSQTYTITPNSGYQIADVLVDGASVGIVSTYTFNNVIAPHSISATFSLIAFPVITVSPSSINYGTLGIGFSLNDTVIITNTGTAPLNISSVISSNSIYNIVYYKNTLAPGDTTNLIIRYTPTAAGSSAGTITINHNAAGNPTVINFLGNAVATGYTYQVQYIPGVVGSLYGATWFSNKIGFVSGANGKLFKTTDGGGTWAQLPFAGTATLYSIRSIGSELWLFGSNGHICVSHDGGLTFTVFATGTTNIFYDGYFVNGYYGFAVGSNGTLCRYNGTAWEPYNLGLPNNFYGVYAYGRSAWAVGSGGIVCRYNYSSNSWGPANPGVTNDLYGVGFWNDNIGYVVGSGGLIYKTSNGGTSWTPCVSGVNVNIRSVRCFSANVAWASCENGDILQTTDGGITWVRLPLGGFTFQRLDFNGCQGIAICNNGAVVTFQTNLCNGGYNTSRYVRRGTGTTYGYNSAWYSTKLNGGIAGRYGTVLITNNGGLTWGSTNPYTTESINCIKIFGNTSFIAGSGGYIAKCNNLGTNWVRFPGIPGNINFHSIAFYPNGTGWAVGSGGTICYYNGSGWIPYNLGGITNTFRCVYVIGNVAYAVGDNGIICKYNGVAWVDVSPGVSNNFYGCAFVTPLIGYAVGSGGIICKTIDGGQTWFAITSPTTEDHLCVEVGCKLEAMVAGKNGEAFQTTDGGSTWIDYSLDRAVNINGITLFDGEGLLAAEDGEVYAFQFGSGKVVAELTAAGPTTFCEGGSVVLTASGGTSYLWSNGETTPSITVTGAGTYSVTVSNAAGCSDEKQIIVIVNSKPIVTFTVQPEICINNGSINLAATPAGGTFSGAGVSGNTFDPLVAGAGVKTLAYTVTNNEGCDATKKVEIVVNDVPTLSFTLPSSTCINAGTITLAASPSGGIFSGTGVTGSQFDPTTAGRGTTTITYTLTTDKGCTSTTTANIIVNDIAALSLSLPASVCSNAVPLTLTASPAGGTFSGSGVTGNVLSPLNAGTGTHTITYYYTNADGCTSSITKNITVNSTPIANAGTDKQVYYGYTPLACTVLSGSASSGTSPYTYSWSNGTSTIANNVCPTVNTIYTLTVTDANFCSSTDAALVRVTDVRCGPGNRKVKVCHTEPKKQDVNICIDEHAVAKHLADGDYLGDCLTATVAAISDVVSEAYQVDRLQVYPNPSNGNFVVELQDVKSDVSISIFNLNGSVIARKVVKGNSSTKINFNLPLIGRGIYLVQVFADNKMQTKKLIIH